MTQELTSRHLDAMSPERRAQLEAEWVDCPISPRTGECALCGRMVGFDQQIMNACKEAYYEHG